MGQLYWYAFLINGTDDSAKGDARLTADIVVNSGKMYADSANVYQWIPIGNATGHSEGQFFTYNFDGQGHSISGLYCAANPTYFFGGLFGCIANGGTVKNVSVRNSYFYASKGAGAISGGNSDLTKGGLVENCSSINNIIYGENNAGGIVGGSWYDSSIKNCFTVGCEITSGTDKNDSNAHEISGYIAFGGNITEDMAMSGCNHAGNTVTSAAGNYLPKYSGLNPAMNMGDADKNGTVDILDAIFTQKKAYVSNDLGSALADLDGNGILDDKDTALLLKMLCAA